LKWKQLRMIDIKNCKDKWRKLLLGKHDSLLNTWINNFRLWLQYKHAHQKMSGNFKRRLLLISAKILGKIFQAKIKRICRMYCLIDIFCMKCLIIKVQVIVISTYCKEFIKIVLTSYCRNCIYLQNHKSQQILKYFQKSQVYLNCWFKYFDLGLFTAFFLTKSAV